MRQKPYSTLKHSKAFDDHRPLFIQADYAAVQQQFKSHQQALISFIVLFNYFEGISIGVQQGIMDETFMKEFFKTVFTEYHKYCKGYIEYLRNETRSPAIFRRFTEVAEKWRNEN